MDHNLLSEEKGGWGYFVLRQFHSITGLFLLGLFLWLHLATHLFILRGEEAYIQALSFIFHLPYLDLWRVLLVWLPLIFHISMGCYIISRASFRLSCPNSLGNWLYFFQRLSALIALMFLAYHIAYVKLAAPVDLVDATARARWMLEHLKRHLEKAEVFGLYLVGIGALVFHYVNGIRLFCLRWGLVSSSTSRKILLGICGGIGGLMFWLWLEILLRFHLHREYLKAVI
ncbi:MAG: hypothetical protein D6805_07990 [Planctomycetota bacterium]|nr:MAG: hypothetical protein D6805_07990 [Planctomycetota bacterium]